MKYTFDIVGVSPTWEFFNHQQQTLNQRHRRGVEYLSTHKCTLDALLESVEPLPVKRGWNTEQVRDAVVQFWVNNAESIRYWKVRLIDAGHENILIARLADITSLQAEFESLLGK
ncbi:hypothetical protein [Umezakia ovalisporum]|jgi:hypothetical protein|uniref:Uncharacterized protein n=2 Tax=Umezakia ovalisporum TaxID=75695 RepID=A0AA43H2A3_9CYAN|nr:hypothetical protein [Umezakia ovalisporum]MBI1241657.1 hypothetical protein [Nostoc sp. RI_552]MDH6058469.1 hypothetical protein [Umezakia ovalisporum FSS-43]MDH6065433.1 hypothetical protein [Umezakia ovalisporum FSS-62]MDH6067036.1 hypothetical protein [Umezakia ovalisporum APH033B]MDH6071647.1 hypothetical protein [Umezakia ovalisporum CobakiLakeA]